MVARCRLIVLSSLVLAIAALSPVAALGKARGTDRPLKAALSSTGTDTPSGPDVLIGVFTGSGHMSHLGRVTFRADQTFTGATGTAVGTVTFTAANGDTLTASYSGPIEPTPSPEIFRFRLDATVTGGTGRFAGATGTFVTTGTSVTVSFDPMTGGFHTKQEAIVRGRISY